MAAEVVVAVEAVVTLSLPLPPLSLFLSFLTHEPHAVIVELVVGGERDEAAEGDAKGIEDLNGGVAPHLHLLQAREVRLQEVEIDPFHRPVKGDAWR